MRSDITPVHSDVRGARPARGRSVAAAAFQVLVIEKSAGPRCAGAPDHRAPIIHTVSIRDPYAFHTSRTGPPNPFPAAAPCTRRPAGDCPDGQRATRGADGLRGRKTWNTGHLAGRASRFRRSPWAPSPSVAKAPSAWWASRASPKPAASSTSASTTALTFSTPRTCIRRDGPKKSSAKCSKAVTTTSSSHPRRGCGSGRDRTTKASRAGT